MIISSSENSNSSGKDMLFPVSVPSPLRKRGRGQYDEKFNSFQEDSSKENMDTNTFKSHNFFSQDSIQVIIYIFIYHARIYNIIMNSSIHSSPKI